MNRIISSSRKAVGWSANRNLKQKYPPLIRFEMKNEIYKVVFFIPLLFFSCTYVVKNNSPQPEDSYSLISKPEQCFTAVFQKDSAFLKFKTMANGKILGKLIIKYGELEPLAVKKEFYRGDISGQFNRDTLFIDYVFTDRDEKGLYRNPLALLRKNDKLMLGFGATINYLGRTWFRRHQEINFNNSRFQFTPAVCIN